MHWSEDGGKYFSALQTEGSFWVIGSNVNDTATPMQRAAPLRMKGMVIKKRA